VRKIKGYLTKTFRMNGIICLVFFTSSFGAFAFGIISPFISIFAVQEIKGGNLAVAGLAAGISPLVQGATSILGGVILDRISRKTERYIFIFFVVQQLSNAIYLFIMAFVIMPWQLYLVQVVRGGITGVTFPAGNMIQSKYIDKGKEGTQWGIAFAIFNIFFGIGGILAGQLIEPLGFRLLFVLCGVIYLVATIFAWKALHKMVKLQKSKLKPA